jgi:hypothetical protein
VDEEDDFIVACAMLGGVSSFRETSRKFYLLQCLETCDDHPVFEWLLDWPSRQMIMRACVQLPRNMTFPHNMISMMDPEYSRIRIHSTYISHCCHYVMVEAFHCRPMQNSMG